MDARKKLSLLYFIFVMGFASLGVLIYVLMNSIETTTTYLELRLHRRNLSDIVDQNYKADKEIHKEENIELLNELTDFFYDFHSNTLEYKKLLEEFMEQRGKILKRLEMSNINVYDLTVIPNSEIPNYFIKSETVEETMNLRGGCAKVIRKHKAKQIPFSRYLKFSKRVMRQKNANMYLLCSARISAYSENGSRFFANIVEADESFDKSKYMRFRPRPGSKMIFNLNRVMFIQNMTSARIVVRGYSIEPLRIDKVEAYCLNFNDMPNK